MKINKQKYRGGRNTVLELDDDISEENHITNF